jgi:hypothetical protein
MPGLPGDAGYKALAEAGIPGALIVMSVALIVLAIGFVYLIRLMVKVFNDNTDRETARAVERERTVTAFETLSSSSTKLVEASAAQKAATERMLESDKAHAVALNGLAQAVSVLLNTTSGMDTYLEQNLKLQSQILDQGVAMSRDIPDGIAAVGDKTVAAVESAAALLRDRHEAIEKNLVDLHTQLAGLSSQISGMSMKADLVALHITEIQQSQGGTSQLVNTIHNVMQDVNAKMSEVRRDALGALAKISMTLDGMIERLSIGALPEKAAPPGEGIVE